MLGGAEFTANLQPLLKISAKNNLNSRLNQGLLHNFPRNICLKSGFALKRVSACPALTSEHKPAPPDT